uniref:GTD-binding domain-containing protein n=1 Tax=Cannabis sativa TaxID=3483 RepID=A0A803PC76_CANSA
MCENCLSSSSSNDWSNNGKVSFFPWMKQIEETVKKDVSVPHLEFYIGQEDCTLIPVEFSSNKVEEQGKSSNEKEEEDLILDFDLSSGVAKQVEQVTETWVSSGDTLELLSSNECIQSDESRRNSFAFHGEQVELEITREFQKVLIHQATQTLSDDEDFESGHGQAMSRRGEIDLDVNQASEDEIDDAEVSIGTDIPDHDEPIDEIQSKQDPSSSSINLHSDDNNHDDFDEAEEEVVEFKTLSVETNNNHLFFGLELNDNDEEKFHKKLLLLERRESGTEESLDGSVLSDIESGGDGILTMEKLKSVLKSERKALNALYAELEEERSASAVAASQTMAMINRLQEEKAAMQMEALQYQRMMEEQSEYDQEALQLLNDLMTKRERENQELEKELEMYRKRIQDYEAKEKIMVRRMREESIITRSRNSSMSCSNAEDTSDELSVDLNHEAKAEEEDCVGGDNQNTPADAVLYLDESLNGFEEERLSILDQLRVLEEKLFTLQTDEEDRCFEDVKPIEAKRLLPFFDATEEENEDGEESFDFVMMQSPEFERENKKFAIEEEVDHVYERLQALEADREFLKHCISSLSKGDKGLHLLQEILQHLRDLRSVETRVKNMGDVSL